jgi:hypothetical protein
MVLNDYTKKIMAEYIKDMYDAGLVLKYGDYSDAGNAINRRLRGRGFCDFFANCPLNLEEATTIEDIASRLDGMVWVTNSADGHDGTWYWHTRLPRMDDEQFVELINTNRKLYGLSESQYTQSELEHAAELLADNEFEDI